MLSPSRDKTIRSTPSEGSGGNSTLHVFGCSARIERTRGSQEVLTQSAPNGPTRSTAHPANRNSLCIEYTRSVLDECNNTGHTGMKSARNIAISNPVPGSTEPTAAFRSWSSEISAAELKNASHSAHIECASRQTFNSYPLPSCATAFLKSAIRSSLSSRMRMVFIAFHLLDQFDAHLASTRILGGAYTSKLNPRFRNFSYFSSSKLNNWAGRCLPA